MEAEVGQVALDAAPAVPLPLAAVAWSASLAVAVFAARRRARGLPLLPAGMPAAIPWGGREVAAIALFYFAVQVASVSLLPRGATLDVQLAAGIAMNLLVTLFTVTLLRGRGASWRTLGLARAGRDAGLALAALALVLAPLLTVAAVLDAIVPYRHPLVDFLASRGDATAIALAVLAAVGVAPLAEELFFRRVLQGWLEARVPEADGAVAVVGSAAAFALAHTGQGLAWIPLFLFGIVLGWIARRTGSVVPCILLHAAFNAVSVALLVSTAGSAAAAGS